MFLKEPSDIENKSSICTWDRYAACLRLLQEMLKLRNLYEKIEEKLSPPVRTNIFILFLVVQQIKKYLNFSDSSVYFSFFDVS